MNVNMAYNPQNPNGQAAMVSSTPVVIASNQSNLGTNAYDGAGNAITSNSTTTTSTRGIDLNVRSILGTAPTTAGYVNIQGNPTAASAPAFAVETGSIAATSLPTATTTAQLTGTMSDKFGRQVVIPNAMRDLVLPMTQLTLTASTVETTLITAVTSTFLDILVLVVINTSASATQVDFRDSTAGTVRLSLYIPAGDTRGIALPTPLPQNAVNNNWTAKCNTSVSSIIISGTYITNK
jgi:hypothetical protein